MNSFGTWVMSVDEVFGPVLPEPTRVSESPWGYSPHFKRVWERKVIFLREDSRCGHIQVKQKIKNKSAALPSLTWAIKPRPLLFFHLDRVPHSPARFRYITQGTDGNVLLVKRHFFFFMGRKSKRLLPLRVILSGCDGLQHARMVKGNHHPDGRQGDA